MFDMRYHIASLVAVFLALGVGILLGTVIVDKGVVAQQIEDLRSRYEVQNRELSRGQRAADDFQRNVLPTLVAARLENARVGYVVSPGSDAGLVEKVAETLSLAGAKGSKVRIVDGNFATDDAKAPQVRALVKMPSAQLAAKSEKGAEAEKLTQAVAARLGVEIGGTSSRKPLKILTDLGIVETSGEGTLPVSAVVIVDGGGEKLVGDWLVPLSESLRRLSVPVVVVGSSTSPADNLALFRRSGVSTVNNVDTIPGQFTLVQVLRGNRGDYGVGSSGGLLLPSAKR